MESSNLIELQIQIMTVLKNKAENLKKNQKIKLSKDVLQTILD